MIKNTSENAKELPNGWEWKTVGEIANLVTKGSSPKWQGVDYTEKGENSILFITSENVGAYEILTKNLKYVEEEFNKIEPRSILNKGDILMNIVGASIGRTAIYNLDEVANINQAVCLIRLNEKLINKMFALHFFNSSMCIELMFDKQVDNARANLSMGHIKDFEIPLPPLKEQERIVKKLDTAFQSLDEAITLQKENIAHTQELKKAVLVEQISNLSCEMKKLGEVVKTISGYAFNSNDFASNNHIKSIKITNVGVNNFVQEFDNLLPIDFNHIYKDFLVSEGDIVIALTRPIISDGLKIAIVPKEYNDSLVNQRVACLKQTDKSNLNFVYYYLTSQIVYEYIADKSRTLNQPNLSIKDLNNIQIPLPTLPEQERIVAYLDMSFAKLDALMMEQEERLAQLMELKKSILQEAFEGKL